MNWSLIICVLIWSFNAGMFVEFILIKPIKIDMTLSKSEREHLMEHHKAIIEEHKKGIVWHEEEIKNNQRRINQLVEG